MAGAALAQGQVQIWWQAQHSHKVKYRFGGKVKYRFGSKRSTFGADFAAGENRRNIFARPGGRRSTCARSGTDFVWKAQHSHRFGGKRKTFGADFAAGKTLSALAGFVAGAALAQG